MTLLETSSGGPSAQVEEAGAAEGSHRKAPTLAICTLRLGQRIPASQSSPATGVDPHVRGWVMKWRLKIFLPGPFT